MAARQAIADGRRFPEAEAMPRRIVDASGKMATAARAYRPEGCDGRATASIRRASGTDGERYAPGARRWIRDSCARNAAHGNYAISS